MSLFQKSVVNKYLSNLDSDEFTSAYNKFQEFYDDSERIENIKLLKEENYQEGFLREIFVQVLGYTINPDKNYNLTTEYKNETDSKKADGAIIQDGKAIGVIELKSTKTVNLESITTQAFNYKNHQSGCKYVITSNFAKLRFYIENATEWEEFNLFTMTEEDFKLFYLLLNSKNLLSGIPLRVKEESRLHEESISDKLYKDYSQFKHKIYNNLVKNNPQYDKLVLFKKSQKLLDRLLFILFAEDSGLVPPNAISRIVDQWKQLKALDEEKPLYSRFVKFFNHLNVGHTYEDYTLPAYNGGLFREDEILDTVKIDDEVLLDDILTLSAYDFSTEVDVNILGHIFEHSLSEIEVVTAQIEGTLVEREKSKRKKDGIFYTPKYITKYIVDNTVGALCSEKKKELNVDVIDEAILENSKTTKGTLTQKAQDIFINLDKYREYILSLKILDPACGSGAFLNQALEFLINEHKWIDEQKASLLKESFIISEYEKNIVENNLYGVDINEEAVEIAKLSLWLRTAKKGRKLSTLSNNIKCGNSLIDDPEVAGEKAFKWNEEFKEIMSDGGFDVVIGNPPYVQFYEFNEYYSKYYITSACGDLYVLFIEKGISLLKKEGLFSFITPSLYIKGLKYASLREFLLDKIHIIEILDKGDGVFKNVQMPTAILTLVNSKEKKQSWKEFIPGIGIITKLEHNSLLIGDLSKIMRGLEIGKDKVNYGDSDIEILTGENISRYSIKSKNFISNDIYMKYKKDEYYFTGSRIVIRETGIRLTSTYLSEDIQQNRSLYSIKLIDGSIEYLYLLAIINSKTIQYYYKTAFAANTNIFPKIRIAQVKNIPIKRIPNKNQQPFIEKTEKMLEMNKELQQKKNAFLSRLKDNLRIEKISKKLDTFYDFDFKVFISELKKQKETLSLKQQDEWEEYFNEYKTKINQLQNQINETDNEIDVMVYKLYNLTYDEVKIVDPEFWMSKEEYEKFEIEND